MRPILACGLFLLALLFSGAANAQEQAVRTIPFEGPEFFCHILHYENLQPVLTVSDAEADPLNTMVIVLGNPRLEFLLRGRLESFLDSGGNVLIATDYPLNLPKLGLEVPDARVHQRVGAFLDKEECPKVTIGELNLGNDHPVLALLGKGIATNRPSYVKIRRVTPTVQPLLDFPLGVTRHENGFRHEILFSLPYMAGSPAKAPARGRLLLIAGSGMFINGMMAQPSCDNFDFTVNVVRWLREQPNGGKRKRALLIVDAEIVTDFDMKLTPGPPPIPMPTVQAINRLLHGWEREGFIPNMIQDMLGDNLGRCIGVLLVLATFGLVIYGSKKVLEGRAHLENSVPTMVGVPLRPKTGNALEERGQAKLRKRDYGPECRQLAREWMRDQFGVTPKHWLPGVQAEFRVQGYFWPPWKLRRQAAFVLRLARGEGLPWVSRHEFFLLAEALRDLTAALKESRLALLVEGKNVRQV